MNTYNNFEIHDNGERILPTEEGEVSFVFSRHNFAYRYARNFVRDKTVIDIGCGTGYGSNILSEQAKFVYGIDYHPGTILYCKEHYNASNIRFYQRDATKLEFKQQFDVAVCFQIIEHIDNISDFIERIKRLVKPGGKILISTPNVKETKKGQRKNPYHLNEMTFAQFNNLLQKHFSTCELLGVAYASKNRLRDVLGKMPFYKWGKLLKRKSRLKKLAGKALDMTSFRVINTDIEEESADLFAVCVNHLVRG